MAGEKSLEVLEKLRKIEEAEKAKYNSKIAKIKESKQKIQNRLDKKKIAEFEKIIEDVENYFTKIENKDDFLLNLRKSLIWIFPEKPEKQPKTKKAKVDESENEQAGCESENIENDGKTEPELNEQDGDSCLKYIFNKMPEVKGKYTDEYLIANFNYTVKHCKAEKMSMQFLNYFRKAMVENFAKAMRLIPIG